MEITNLSAEINKEIREIVSKFTYKNFDRFIDFLDFMDFKQYPYISQIKDPKIKDYIIYKIRRKANIFISPALKDKKLNNKIEDLRLEAISIVNQGNYRDALIFLTDSLTKILEENIFEDLLNINLHENRNNYLETIDMTISYAKGWIEGSVYR